MIKAQAQHSGPDLHERSVERVTRIELALSAWEAQRLRLPGALTRRPWRS